MMEQTRNFSGTITGTESIPKQVNYQESTPAEPDSKEERAVKMDRSTLDDNLISVTNEKSVSARPVIEGPKPVNEPIEKT
jgi:hypothetical protein